MRHLAEPHRIIRRLARFSEPRLFGERLLEQSQGREQSCSRGAATAAASAPAPAAEHVCSDLVATSHPHWPRLDDAPRDRRESGLRE